MCKVDIGIQYLKLKLCCRVDRTPMFDVVIEIATILYFINVYDYEY